MLRPATLLAPVVALVFATAAQAHGDRSVAGFRSTVSGVHPLVPGLLVEVLGADDLLSVRNWSGKTVVLEGAGGRPFLRFDDTAVYLRAGGRWRLAKRGTSYAWHDRRIHWVGPIPERSRMVARWRIPGAADGEPFAIRGFIGYAAPAGRGQADDGLSALVIAALAFGAVVLAAALALPLVRRKDEGESEEPEPTGS